MYIDEFRLIRRQLQSGVILQKHVFDAYAKAALIYGLAENLATLMAEHNGYSEFLEHGDLQSDTHKIIRDMRPAIALAAAELVEAVSSAKTRSPSSRTRANDSDAAGETFKLLKPYDKTTRERALNC